MKKLVLGLVVLLACIAGAIVGMMIGGDLWAMAGAFFALVIAVGYVRFQSRESAGNFSERPYIVSSSSSDKE